MNDVSLERLVDARLEGLRGEFVARLASIERANEVQIMTLDRRLAGMNEFRDTLRDQAGTFVTRSDLSSFREIVEARILSLELSRSDLAGRIKTVAILWSALLAAASVTVSILLRFLR